MPQPLPRIWIGDVIRVLAAVPHTDRQMLLTSLGLQDAGGRMPQPRLPVPEQPRPTPPPPASPDQSQMPLLEILEPVERLASSPVSSSPPAPRAPTGLVAPIAHSPLLTPGQDRHVLYAALAQPRPTPRLDLKRAIERLARLQPLVPVPFAIRLSLVPGSQLLLDIGAGMELFGADQADVTATAERVLGRSNVHVQQFRQVPTRAAGSGSGPVWTWQPYSPPPPRTPVLFVTDLGLGAPLGDAVPAAPFEWAALFDALSHRDIVPVILIPYRAFRVPRELRQRAVIVSWERDARPRRIRNLVQTKSRRGR